VAWWWGRYSFEEKRKEQQGCEESEVGGGSEGESRDAIADVVKGEQERCAEGAGEGWSSGEVQVRCGRMKVAEDGGSDGEGEAGG
jgi:hypothetical protein